MVKKNIHITKRDLFYTDVKLFTKQEESDSILDDVSVMLGCTRTSLNVVASDLELQWNSGTPLELCHGTVYMCAMREKLKADFHAFHP